LEKTMLASIEEALHDYAMGRIIIVVDDEQRENEGDLVCAGQFATPESIAFMAREGRGLICLAMTGEQLDRLNLPLMVGNNTSPLGTNFTVSVEAATGVTTGISAADRARTIQVAINPQSKPEDLVRPGHIFPLRAMDGGVLVRAGHTEASVDLARMAGLLPAGVICEIMNDDGTMARVPEIQQFAERHQLKIISVAQLIAHRRRYDSLIERGGQATIPTCHGNFRAISYQSPVEPTESIAMIAGDVTTDEPVLVRVHSECLTGDVFGSLRCDCRSQLELAMERIGAEGRGVVLYLRQEGRGIGIHNKLRAYALQEEGFDTVEANEELGFPADLRDYGIGAQILADLGVRRIRLMTNNPRKIVGLQGYGLEIVERVPMITSVTPYNTCYLDTKRTKLGHLFCDDTGNADEENIEAEKASAEASAEADDRTNDSQQQQKEQHHAEV
jgi:3,4-dihydroxy 2-butanone 4-phosphate synthase/GTP cyclohydrolase II